MREMLLVALLGLSRAVVAEGNDPKPQAEPKPPWQRLLTGAAAETSGGGQASLRRPRELDGRRSR
jgi:hypothetical protein